MPVGEGHLILRLEVGDGAQPAQDRADAAFDNAATAQSIADTARAEARAAQRAADEAGSGATAAQARADAAFEKRWWAAILKAASRLVGRF